MIFSEIYNPSQLKSSPSLGPHKTTYRWTQPPISSARQKPHTESHPHWEIPKSAPDRHSLRQVTGLATKSNVSFVLGFTKTKELERAISEASCAFSIIPNYDNIYEAHNEFNTNLNMLINPQNLAERPRFYTNKYDVMSDIITHYNTKLHNVPDDALNLFFDYTDLLEGLLLVMKRRHLTITDIREDINELFTEFKNIYLKIYPTLIHHDLTDYASIRENLAYIKEKMENISLMPTIDEYHDEITENIEKMNETEMKELAGIYKI